MGAEGFRDTPILDNDRKVIDFTRKPHVNPSVDADFTVQRPRKIGESLLSTRADHIAAVTVASEFDVIPTKEGGQSG